MPLHDYLADEERPVVNVRDLFLKEIVDGGMEFINETYKALFDDYLVQINEGKEITEAYYLNHQEAEYRNFAINTLHFHYNLSKLFYPDKTINLDEVNSKLEAEKLALDKLVIESLLTYKQDRIKTELEKLQNSDKSTLTEEEVMAIVERIMQLTTFKTQIAIELKRF
jgi:hypothetical protein